MKNVICFLTGTSVLLASSMALAGPLPQQGASVTWEAGSAAIPTLGFWGIAAMALLMGVVAARLLKGRSTAIRMVSVALIVGTFALGGQLAHTTISLPPIVVDDPDCAGGTEFYPESLPVELTNTCSNPIIISEYDFSGIWFPECAVLEETCPVDTVLNNGQSCTLNYYSLESCP